MNIRVLAWIVVCVPLAVAQDWGRFKGPDGAGLSGAPSVPVSFTMDDVNWRVPLPGKGHSSPVIWKGRIFLTCNGAKAGTRSVVCLNAKDGSVRWKREREFAPHAQHRFNSFASSTPVVDAERVYVVWSTGEQLVATALDHDGKPAWRTELGHFSAQHGSGASPIVVKGVVVIGNDNEGENSFLVGLDKKTGKEIWRRPRESSRASYATPIVRRMKTRVEVLFASTSHGITSLDPKTGKPNWETGPVFKYRCVGSPGIADGVLLATAGSGGGGKDSIAYELPMTAKGKPKELYRMRRALPYVPSVLGIGKRFFLFGDGGVLSCIDAKTGDVTWRERVEGSFYSSPVCIGNRIFAMSRRGALYVIEAADTFRLLGSVELGDPSSATPAVANGVLYLRTERHLVSVGGAR
ncbi:MAG: hypothetical protein CMJ83_16870 [Planctomycetes bacterium]|nr:hypothetical protein [Planctomycetota bacterium]